MEGGRTKMVQCLAPLLLLLAGVEAGVGDRRSHRVGRWVGRVMLGRSGQTCLSDVSGRLH